MGEAPKPKSPPRYPDLCGRRRLQLEVQILNREVGFLESYRDLNGFSPSRGVAKNQNCALACHVSAVPAGAGASQSPRNQAASVVHAAPAATHHAVVDRAAAASRSLLAANPTAANPTAAAAAAIAAPAGFPAATVTVTASHIAAARLLLSTQRLLQRLQAAELWQLLRRKRAMLHGVLVAVLPTLLQLLGLLLQLQLPKVLVCRGAVRRLLRVAPALPELPVVVLQGAAVLLQVPVVVLRGGAILLRWRRRQGIIGVLLWQVVHRRRRESGAVVPRMLVRLRVLMPQVQRWVQLPVVQQPVLCRRMLMLK
uniref:Uncharacterized protein n=1 Tax=Leersia perrieri TaxID=77586 RepID=A0A0D9X8K6_9ORYZ